MGDPVDELLEDVLTDADGDSEQLEALALAFEERARLPFRASVVGTEVDVVAVEYGGDERRGLVAVTERDGRRYPVALLDLAPVGPLPLATAQLLAAHRRWAGAEPLPEPPADRPEPVAPWRYRPLARLEVDVERPLALEPCGAWDPDEEYWGKRDQALPPLLEQILSAGPRPQFEMEQVVPGVPPDDWDADPILDAVDLHHAGQHGRATRLLEDLIAADDRCLDAWAHLGLVRFETRGAAAARSAYETGVAIGERSLPEGFGGLLPRGLIDNRPFLRCVHGLGICAWRSRRWDDAEAAFTSLSWLEPNEHSALSCLLQVTARSRWHP